MTKKTLKIMLVVLVVGLLVACGGGYDAGIEPQNLYPSNPYPTEPEEPYEPEELYEPEEIEEPEEIANFATDALHLVEIIEQTHPIFVADGWLAEDYGLIRDEFLLYAQNPYLTGLDFAFAIHRYLTTLRDGHMSGAVLVPVAGGFNLAVYGGTFNIDWIAIDGNLYYDGQLVETIGGVSVSEVLATVDRYFYPENETDRQFNYARFSRLQDIIERAGGEIINNTLEITLQDEYDTTTITVHRGQPGGSQGFDFIIRYEILDDIFFIDLRSFQLGEHITDTAYAITQAIDDGIRKFIVDLRSNGGGDSRAGQELLEAMGIVVPSFGGLRRISPLAIDQREVPEDWLNSEYASFEPNIWPNNNPNNVFVSILTDAQTFSSANMMAAWVQDGGFGNIVGSPSRQAPSAFGDMLSYTLPYSGFFIHISYTQFLRPNPLADQTTLWPDIMVDPEYALDAAIEYLGGL